MSNARNADEFITTLRLEGARTLAQAKQAEKVIVLDALTSIVMKTPVDTGRARGNWQVNLDGPPSSETGRLDKSGRDSIRSGTQVINAAPGFGLYYITNNVHYVPYLEEGSSKQAPQGMVALTIQEILTKYGGIS